jgi:hypothetical protein
LYEIQGHVVRVLVNESQPAGEYEVVLHAEGLESGIYFYELSYQSSNDTGFSETKKMILNK